MHIDCRDPREQAAERRHSVTNGESTHVPIVMGQIIPVLFKWRTRLKAAIVDWEAQRKGAWNAAYQCMLSDWCSTKWWPAWCRRRAGLESPAAY